MQSILPWGRTLFAHPVDWLADTSTQALPSSLPNKLGQMFDMQAKLLGGVARKASQRTAIVKALGVLAGGEFQLLKHHSRKVAGALRAADAKAERQRPTAPLRMLDANEHAPPLAPALARGPLSRIRRAVARANLVLQSA